MTPAELLRIGDKVVFTVGPEVRAFTRTYNNVPDGTEGIVCGFVDRVIYQPRVPVPMRQPGVYHGRGGASVWLPDGRVIPGEGFIKMVDKDEENRRDTAIRDVDGVLRPDEVRLGDLPETKFWEQDKVLVRFPHDVSVHDMTIKRIDYCHMHSCRHDGSPWPIYDVQYGGGGQTSVEESWIVLIERGNLWKYYNNQPLSFANLEVEALFFRLVGQTEEIRNPRNGLYSWTEEEVLEDIRKGYVHGFFVYGPRIIALRFKDVALGERVAKAMLEGLKIVT